MAQYFLFSAASLIQSPILYPTMNMTLSERIVAHGFVDPNDPVAISFWIISISMVAATVFFLMESMTVSVHWKTSLNVGALVTLVAAVHYFYMREFWVLLHSSPILYRYIDWTITVPLQMIEFYLILAAVKPDIGKGMFLRLLFGTVAMLAFGYAGEAKIMNPRLGFGLGMAGWGFILFEIFVGEAGSVVRNDPKVNQYVKEAFNTMRFVVAHGFVDPNDPVAISFWIISISMVAATVFFLMESMTVSVHWKTSLNVGALVTLVAAWPAG